MSFLFDSNGLDRRLNIIRRYFVVLRAVTFWLQLYATFFINEISDIVYMCLLIYLDRNINSSSKLSSLLINTSSCTNIFFIHPRKAEKISKNWLD